MSSPGQSCIIVDTNVLCVAEGLHPEASDECAVACLAIANQISAGLTIAVDDDDLILSEYLGALKDARTAGTGAKLAAYLFQRRFHTGVCRRVQITPTDVPEASFEEVPEALRDFDSDDHKFIAVAAAEGNRPPILTAVDREWWDRRDEFAQHGIDVQFLCIAHLLANERGTREASAS
jgi:hypothetical protein